MSKTLGERLADLNIEVGTAMTIDWEQVRINASIKIEGSILSNYDFFGQAIQIECNNTGKTRTQVIAQMAVELADDLVAALKKGGQDGRD